LAKTLSRILRGGVWGAGLLIFAGLALALRPGASPQSGAHLLHGGLLVLIAAPILGAAAAGVFYARAGRWRLFLAAVSLLIMIAVGAIIGK
jgi:hypothetical protein